MKKIIILGGGGAGWLTALSIKRHWPNTDITVVEDTSIPPIIAGEAGATSLLGRYKDLGIDITSWIKECGAMPKLGSIYNDWDVIGKSFVQSVVDRDQHNLIKNNPEYRDFQNILPKLYCAANKNLSDNYDRGWLIKENKTRQANFVPLDEGNHNDMYHFDSRANAEFLKKIALQRKIKHLDRKYIDALQDESGNITELLFEHGDSIKGDWFFDCSGFARLLLVKKLKAEYQDNSHMFPASSVVAWWLDDDICKSYTELTAMKYGWSFNINLAHRSGNGYIYDSSEISVDKAIEEAEIRFGSKINPVANVSFVPGTVKKFWINNVIGIGLSTGFSDPLESNGMALVTNQILTMFRYWNPIQPVNSGLVNEFNDNMYSTVTIINDFISLHFTGKRTDSSYWLKLKDKTRFSDAVNNKIEMYKDGIIVVDQAQTIYVVENFIQIAQGLNLLDTEKVKLYITDWEPDIMQRFEKYYNQQMQAHKIITDHCYTTREWKNLYHATK